MFSDVLCYHLDKDRELRANSIEWRHHEGHLVLLD